MSATAPPSQWVPALAGLALLLAGVAAVAAPDFPALSGRVVDAAGIIADATEAEITTKLAALEAKTTDQLVVVTLPSLQGYDIADFGYQLGRHWAIGQAGKDNGVLLIVAPSERKVRIEVGYGLEGTLTDAITRVVIDNAILSRFRADDMAGGIVRGVDDIIQVLSGEGAEIRELAERRPDEVHFLTAFLPLAIWVIIIIIIASNILGRGRTGRRSGSGWMSGGSSWSSSSSGGGFSGGGGSFGGGGSSGSW